MQESVGVVAPAAEHVAPAFAGTTILVAGRGHRDLVTQEHETEGLDSVLHGEKGYNL